MSVYADFARREQADQYNSAVFSLLHYLSIRVAMTVKQKMEGGTIHPRELKFYRHCLHHIKKIKLLEKDKHNPPMFSTATSRLTTCLSQLLLSQDPTAEGDDQADNQQNLDVPQTGKAGEREKTNRSSGLGSSFSSFNNKSLNSTFIPMKQKPSLLSL